MVEVVLREVLSGFAVVLAVALRKEEVLNVIQYQVLITPAGCVREWGVVGVGKLNNCM